VTQRLLRDAETLGDVADRAALTTHEPHRLTAELLGIRRSGLGHGHHPFAPRRRKRSDVHESGGTPARLLRNQDDIGDAIKPYYGRAAGNQLTALLKEHILGAVALLKAAKSGDQALIKQRTDEWYANGNEIADFLHKSNPRNWSRKALRRMMKGHLDQTLSEAVHRLTGKYDADVRDYDKIHNHILMMADTLSRGIIKQFPRRFR
jgi:hypothetical protein